MQGQKNIKLYDIVAKSPRVMNSITSNFRSQNGNIKQFPEGPQILGVTAIKLRRNEDLTP